MNSTYVHVFLYTSHCSSSTLDTLSTFVCKFDLLFPPLPPPLINLDYWPGCTPSTSLSPVAGWVGPLSHLIFSYPQVGWAGCFILWVSSLPPQRIHWVCPLTAQGFCPHPIYMGVSANHPTLLWGLCPLTTPLSVRSLGFVSANRPTMFVLWGLCPLTAPPMFVLWGLCPLTAPLSLQGVFANHPITIPRVCRYHPCLLLS